MADKRVSRLACGMDSPGQRLLFVEIRTASVRFQSSPSRRQPDVRLRNNHFGARSVQGGTLQEANELLEQFRVVVPGAGADKIAVDDTWPINILAADLGDVES